jgi:hypothetical protein
MITADKFYNFANSLKQEYGENVAKAFQDQVEAAVVIDGLTSEFSDDERYIFDTVASRQKTIKEDDVLTLIFEMSSFTRERSHGAALLSKVFLNKDLHTKLLESLELSEIKKCVVAKAEVVLSDSMTSKYPAVGLCKPKFDVINPDLLVVVGDLNAN